MLILPREKIRAPKAAGIALGASLIGLLWTAQRPSVPEPTDAMKARAANVEILRDRYGIPHIFGKTDADAAFGFAYASAEDHWETTQSILIAGRGEISRTKLSAKALKSDFFVQFTGLHDIIEAGYDSLRPDVRTVLESYAQGLNYYASKHPLEADARFLPWTGKDIARQFLFKATLFMGVTKAMRNVLAGELSSTGTPSARNGSNAHAVASFRSADGIARLNVNSHLDWEGFRAWQEAHIVSEEGWNFSGGYLAATPFFLIGHNNHLGWTLTVNRPDLVDVYEIERDPHDPLRYKFDNEWKTMQTRIARLPLEFGPFSWTLKKKFFQTVHGPALEANGKLYAFRIAGIERALNANTQIYDMNKATNLIEFKRAVNRHAIPMFNIVYADAENLYYHYNGLIPQRLGGYNWKGVVPGNLDLDSRGAALVIKTYNPIYNKQYEPEKAPDPRHAFRQAVAWLVAHHGRVDPLLRDVQFIERGGIEIPIAGGPSVLHMVDRHRSKRGKLYGTHGDGFLQIVEFPKGKPARSTAIHQFGSSARTDSKHFSDQMDLFAKRTLRPTWRTRKEIEANLERAYHP